MLVLLIACHVPVSCPCTMQLIKEKLYWEPLYSEAAWGPCMMQLGIVALYTFLSCTAVVSSATSVQASQITLNKIVAMFVLRNCDA